MRDNITKYSPEFIIDFKNFNDDSQELKDKITKISQMLGKSTYDKINHIHKVKKEVHKSVLIRNEINSLLNKLSKDNFDTIITKLCQIKMDDIETLQSVSELIFNKIIKEYRYMNMYGNLIKELIIKSKWNLYHNDKKFSIRTVIINLCQNKFKYIILNKLECDESTSYFKEKNERLGTLLLISELHKNRIIANKIIDECVFNLLQDECNECDIEIAIKFMESLNNIDIKEYKNILKKHYKNEKLSKRLEFLILEFINDEIKINERDLINDYLKNKKSNILDKIELNKNTLVNLIDNIFDLSPEQVDIIIDLLIEINKITPINLKNALKIIKEDLDDICIDIPHAKDIYDNIVSSI